MFEYIEQFRKEFRGGTFMNSNIMNYTPEVWELLCTEPA